MQERLTSFILLVIFSVTYLFQLLSGVDKNKFFLGRHAHASGFVIVYVLSLIYCFGASFLPIWAFVALPIAVMLVVTGTPMLGFTAYVQLALFYTILAGALPEMLYGYLAIGIIAVTVFGRVNDDESLVGPFALSHTYTLVVLAVVDSMMHGKMTIIRLFTDVGNVAISAVLLSAIFYFWIRPILFREREQYQELNDPENELLVELKETSTSSYYHAVHTAYFCEKLALVIGADARLAKAGGYYHQIGKMRGKENLKNTLVIAQEYDFPAKLKQILTEYGSKSSVIRSKEAALVLICDTMVATVTYLFDQDKNAQLDYAQIAELVIGRHLESKILDHSQLTLDEIRLIKKYFAEDTVYYDFLR